jgi:hypothetical protein
MYISYIIKRRILTMTLGPNCTMYCRNWGQLGTATYVVLFTFTSPVRVLLKIMIR